VPRKPRLHYPGALYHVISRGNNRQATFLTDQDYQAFLTRLQKLKARVPFRLFAYCLMPNHFHLLLEVAEEPLAKIMQRILTGYTLYFHRTHRRGGHLFQGRYKAFLCQRESYLLELVRYIHLNPVRARLAASPANWSWSGHRGLLDGDDSLLETGAVLQWFSGDPAAARKAYAAFVSDGLSMGHRRDLYPADRTPYLGDAGFVRANAQKHQPPRRIPAARRRDLDDFLTELCARMGVERKAVTGASMARTLTAVRRAFIREAFAQGHRVVEIARMIGRSQPFVSKAVLNVN
jgi:putative transposase